MTELPTRVVTINVQQFVSLVQRLFWKDLPHDKKPLLWNWHPARSSAWPVSRIQKPILDRTLPAIPSLLLPKDLLFVSSFAAPNPPVLFLSFPKQQTIAQREREKQNQKIAERVLKWLHLWGAPPLRPEMQFADCSNTQGNERRSEEAHLAAGAQEDLLFGAVQKKLGFFENPKCTWFSPGRKREGGGLGVLPWVNQARVNLHPHWYLHQFEWGLFVTILSSENVRFGLRDPDLVKARDTY